MGKSVNYEIHNTLRRLILREAKFMALDVKKRIKVN